jgi:hypothetical protein
MDRNMPNREQLERWLSSEEAEQDAAADDAADAAFAHLFAAMPQIEPGAEFVQRTVAGVWRLRARRRRAVAFAWAASVVIAAAGCVAGYVVAVPVCVWMVKTGVLVTSHAAPWLIAYATVAIGWWSTLGHVGSVIASALITPARASAVVGVELVGLVAFFALQRIAGAGRFGDAQV